MTLSTLECALAFATKAHAGQTRDGDYGLPYVTHPIEVMALLRYVGEVTDETLLTVAALHDVIEEAPGFEGDLLATFGPRVHRLVRELTRSEPTAPETAGLTEPEVWQLRNDRFMAEIKAMSKEAQAVKLADRLANIRQAKTTRSPKKLLRYCAQTEAILGIIGAGVNASLYRAVQKEVEEIRARNLS